MSVNKLFGISIIGAVGCLGMFHMFRKSVSENLLNNPYCKEVMEKVGKNKGAVKFLGEPIEAFSAELVGPGRYFTGQSDVKIVVKGPKSNGAVFFAVVEEEGQLKVNSVELQIGNDDTKRLLIK